MFKRLTDGDWTPQYKDYDRLLNQMEDSRAKNKKWNSSSFTDMI